MNYGKTTINSEAPPPPPPEAPPPPITEGTNKTKALWLSIFAFVVLGVSLILPFYWAGLGTLVLSEFIGLIAMYFSDKATKAKEPNARTIGIIVLIAVLAPVILLIIINWYFSQTF